MIKSIVDYHEANRELRLNSGIRKIKKLITSKSYQKIIEM